VFVYIFRRTLREDSFNTGSRMWILRYVAVYIHLSLFECVCMCRRIVRRNIFSIGSAMWKLKNVAVYVYV